MAHVLNKWFGRATAPTTIRRQLQGALVGVSMLVTLVIGLAFYYEQRREILSGIDKKLETVAVMARELLPPDYHDRIDGPDSVSPEAFHKIVERNNRLCRELGLEYIWSLLIVNGTNVFTTSTSPDKIAANRLHAKFFEPHSNPELYTRTLTTMRTTFKKNHDKWGDIRVVLIPDTDARGRPYLFGASVRLTDVNRQLAGVVCQSVIFGLSVFLLSLVVSVWVSERVTMPICRLTDTIRAVAAGERALEADESGTVEQATLAKCFNQMNRALQDKIHDLEEARQRMIGLHDAEVRQFESSLDMSGQRFQALLDFAADGILIGSHDGYIIDSNQKMCELFGLRREEILGKHILEMPFTPESMHQTPFRFDAVRKGDLVITERVIRRRDGSEIVVEMHTKMMPDGTYQSIYHDISARKRDEQTLRNIRRLLDESQRIARLGGWEIDLISGQATWTEEVYRIYGVGHDFNIHDSAAVFSFYVSEHAPDMVKALTEGLAKGETCDMECEFRRATGELLWVRVIGQPTFENGKLVRANGCIMDITVRKRAELALAETRRLLDEAQRIAKLGAWKFEVGTGKIIWSDEVYRIHGVGTDFDTNNLERALDFYAPECRPVLQQAMQRAVERAEPFDVELEFVRATGERIWVRANGQAELRDGRVVSVSGSFMDIDVRKRAEELLRKNQQALVRQNEMMSTLLQNLPVAIAMVDVPAGNLLVHNQACLSQLGFEALPETDAKTILSNFTFYRKSGKELCPVDELPLVRAMRGQQCWGEEIVTVHADGRRVAMDVYAAPVTDENGHVWAALVCFADVTERKRMEESLHETRRMLEEAQDIAKLGAWGYDVTAQRLTWSGEVYRIHGVERDYDLGRLLQGETFLVPEHAPAVWQAFRQAVESGTPYELEAELVQPAGTHVWVRVAGRAVYENGTVVRVVGNILDITARKQAEQLLQQQQQELSRQNEVMTALLQNLSVGVFMVEVPSGRPLVINEAASRLLGRGLLPFANVENLGSAYEAYKASDRSRYPVDEMPISLGMQGLCSYVDDLIVVRPDGSERQLEIFGSPVKDEQGQVWASLVSFSDVSERKRVEQALRESEDRYRKLFDMESDAIFLVDVHALRFLDVNRSAETLYGYSREELLQMGPKDLAGDPAFAAETIRKGLVSGENLIRLPDVVEIKKGGATFPGEITGRFFTFNERPVFLAAVRDMTERRRAQELLESWNSLLERRVAERTKEVEMYSNQLRGLAGQLVRAEETERRRIADILHEDLQQILVATRMTLGVALQMTKSAESKTTLAAADGMLDQSIRLTRSLVQDISVPAVREGELPYAVDWLRQQMQEKFNFTVDVTIAGPVPTVSESVYLCLYRSIQELLFNVVKHGRVDRAEVVVRKGCGASVEVIIRDRGCGFSEEAVSQSEKGSKGFGLFSIRERLEGLGGKLDLASAVGKGTTVVLTAPARG